MKYTDKKQKYAYIFLKLKIPCAQAQMTSVPNSAHESILPNKA